MSKDLIKTLVKCFLCLAMIIGTYLTQQILILIPFALIALIIIRSDAEQGFATLIFFLPLATIIKLDPTSMSLFTVLEALYVFKLLFETKSLPHTKLCMAFTLLYFCYLLLVSITRSMSTIIGVVSIALPALCGLYATSQYSNFSYKTYYLAFSAGTLASALCGLLVDYIPRLKTFAAYYFNDRVIGIFDEGSANSVARAYGLFGDPNILAMYIICALACLMTLFLKKEIGIAVWAVPTIILTAIGFTTVSKTYLLLVAALLVLMFVVVIVRNDLRLFGKLLAGLIVIVIFALIFMNVFDMSDIVERYLFRFEDVVSSSGELSMHELTTGRSTILEKYFDSLFSSISRAFIGFGYGGGLAPTLACHNTFIQSLYLSGIIGETLLIMLVVYWRCSINELSARLKANRDGILHLVFPVIWAINLCSLDTFTWDFFFLTLTLALIAGKGVKTDEPIAVDA